jgi:hypothetical protein
MFIQMRDRKVMQNGGESILVPLLYAKHTGVQSYSGYQTLDVDPQEGITGAQYLWKEYACPVTISRRERRQNSGQHQIINLLDGKTQQAQLSFADRINTDLLGTNSANSLNLLGFQDFIENAAQASQTGSPGGINRATFSWWRSQYGDASDSFSTNGLNTMRTVYNSASQGADHPDLIISAQTTYEFYERVLEARERYQTTTATETGQRIAEAGFEFLKYKGAFFFFDDAAQADNLRMINTRYVSFVVDTESDFAIQPFVTPNNQTATTALIVFMGAFTMSNLSRHGLVDSTGTF